MSRMQQAGEQTAQMSRAGSSAGGSVQVAVKHPYGLERASVRRIVHGSVPAGARMGAVNWASPGSAG